MAAIMNRRLAAWLLLLIPSTAFSLEPLNWERRSLPDAPVSVLIPAGSIPQIPGYGRPGFDEVREGWRLQTLKHHEGTSRLILYLRHGSITVNYFHNDPYENYVTLDSYVHDILHGEPWGEDEYGSWKGFPTRLIGRKDKSSPPEAPYGATSLHAVEFGPREYLLVELNCNQNSVKDYLKYLVKIRDSVQYTGKSKPGPWPASQTRASEPSARRLLLPTKDPFYPYRSVDACPPGKTPSVENWPHPGDAICR